MIKKISPLKKQLVKFTLIGLLAVSIDLLFYFILLHMLPEKLLQVVSNEAVSKSISFMCGMTVTYFLNKFWTWKKKDRSGKRVFKFAVLYGIALLINVGSNSALLYVLYQYRNLVDLPFKYFIAFVGASGLSASVSFMGQKFWVFKTSNAILVH
ncbi:GtrA family protein [Lutibacter sp.]|uniref:GtrA family protein n=1 Tax=Lutibacter sp. TaxID=1925666 RepID=UPI0035688372